MKISRFYSVLFIAAFLTAAAPQANAGVEWSTFLGESANNYPYGIAVDHEGNVYVTGRASSENFPTTPGAYDPTHGEYGSDVYVAKFDPSGSRLLYSTFLGGADAESGGAIAVDSEGCAYVTGSTQSSDFPVSPGAFQTIHGSYFYVHNNSDVFVTKLNPSGNELVYSTFIGGNNNDRGNSIAIDADGNAYVTGQAVSPDFPATPDAYDTEYNYHNAYVAKLNSAGSALVYSTFLGGSYGSYHTSCSGIAVDSQGAAYVTGSTDDSHFPVTTNAFDTTYNGGRPPISSDAFVTKFSPSGSDLIYSTYLGGEDDDDAGGITLDDNGNAYVCGSTLSPNFPTTPGVLNTTYINGGEWNFNVFVTKLNALGSALVYSTFVRQGFGYEIVIDGARNACITGWPAVVLILNESGSELLYSSSFKASWPGHYVIAVDAAGDIYVAGVTHDSDFPVTPGAFDTTYNGGTVFVAKLHPDPITASNLWPLYH